MTLSSGYLILAGGGAILTASAIVSGPTLPTNIRIVISNIPVLVRFGVRPALRPTVPKAENISNTITSKLSFSVYNHIIEASITTRAETVTIETAL